MTFVTNGIRAFDRLRREHALLLICSCVAILFFNLYSLPAFNPGGFNSFFGGSAHDESALDTELQNAATSAIGNRDGTVIVMDAQTGRVRAIVNRDGAFTQAMMPGSSIKPFTALAALRAGLIDEDSRTTCPGRFTGLSFSLPCVHADHLPPFSPAQAIAYSCNYYFATLGQRLGRDKLIAILREFDFGQPTGIASEEVAGVVRPCEMGSSARVRGVEANHASEEADCNSREAIGESDHIQVTPIQLLTAYAALVNGGHLYQPQVAAADNFHETERERIGIAPQHRAVLIDGLGGAIRYGTARSAKLDALPLTIIGKTGTANPPKGFRSNGWFIGFAGPFQSNRELDPSDVKIAVLVLLSRAHGSQAAEVAKPIFATYANAISQKGLETQITSNENAASGNKNLSALPHPPLSVSTNVKIHLVHDNITQELSLEDYVLGVMRAEGTTEDQPEALKALAIAVRTFALKNLGRHAKDGYDFCSTTHCQRFVRASNERGSPKLLEAVRSTEDQVLLNDRGELIDSYFGASCGGETANIGDLWGVTPPVYLRGVRDEYCDAGPHAQWTDTISRADLLRALRSDSRTDVGNRLDQVAISTRDDTGRAEFIALDGEHHKTVRGWDFKIIVGRVLGWNVLKSSRFEITRSGSNFVFRGSGFGHGLGLCQEGAHVMAARGASYQKILDKYFPGTSVKRDDEAWRRGERENASSWKLDLLMHPAPLSLSGFPRLAVSPARMLTISSEHFRVTYPAEVDHRDADQVLSILESARNDYLHRASVASLAVNVPTLEIRLNASTGDFTSRTGQPWWAAAATKGNRIELQPVSILKRRSILFTTLRHEFAHVVIDAAGNNRAPRWLEEGFAIYLAGEGKLFSHYQPRGALSNQELERRLERPRSEHDMRALYAQAYATVAELVRDQGEASVWKRLAAN